jgi:hypothetical protein
MSIAEDMKAITDSSVEKEKNNPTVIAQRLFDNVLAQVQNSASRGNYRTTYAYAGSHWRLVYEALVTLLVAEGFQAEEKGDGLVIRWDSPKKRVPNTWEV